MRYVLGIDSGGTKYLVTAQSLDGVRLARIQGPPALHYRMTAEQARLRIDENIDACLSRFNGKRGDCACIVCGTSGIDHPCDQVTVNNIYAGLQGFHCRTVCVNDAVIAHYAATGGVGVLIISGTGSVAFGRNAAGEEARCGGWPPVIFGDEGSGVWIGYMALNHLGQVFDGRRPPSRLSERLQKTLGISGGEGLIAVCIEIEHMRWADPGLSAEVDAAAGEGDEHAIGILREAARHTFALGDSIVRRLGFDKKEETFRIGVWGSAITKSPLHFARLKESFEIKYPAAEVLISDKDASEGACGMALRILCDGE